MKRFLIWYMHPEQDSFNGAVQHVLEEKLKRLGKETETRFIPKLDISPTLTRKEYRASLKGEYPEVVQQEHCWIKWADMIILLFPLWWGSFPADGKGFLDRVLSYGFAYRLQEETPVPLMAGKKIGGIYTTGSPKEAFATHRTYLETLWEEQIFAFCGFQTVPFLHFGNVVQAQDQVREQMLEDVKNFAEQLAAQKA